MKAKDARAAVDNAVAGVLEAFLDAAHRAILTAARGCAYTTRINTNKMWNVEAVARAVVVLKEQGFDCEIADMDDDSQCLTIDWSKAPAPAVAEEK